MGTIIIGPGSMPLPVPVAAPVVQIKAKWSDEWQTRPELELVRVTAMAAGQDLGSCELRRRYGIVKQPCEATFATVGPADLAMWWVRIRLLIDGAAQTIWIGRLSGQAREVHGSDAEPSGYQCWVGYEPLHLLQRIHVGRSYWRQEDGNHYGLQELAWIPDMNGRDERKMIVGNRSQSKFPDDEGTYVYGGHQLWTHREAAEYVLARFVEWPELPDGPQWRLSGQADLLAKITDTVSFSTTQTAAEILHELIPNRLGLDYRITPFCDDTGEEVGFEVQVYVLTAEDWQFGGQTLLRNPNVVQLRASQAIDAENLTIVKTFEQRYDRIRILGKRIVVCCSLEGAVTNPQKPTLLPKWSAALEAAYRAGTGTPLDSGEEHDAARKTDRFRPVYQAYGAPPGWDLNASSAAPALDREGKLKTGEFSNWQNRVRRTLSWLPLREGYDYSKEPPADNNLADHEPDFLPPAVWIFDPDPEEGPGRYVLSDQAAIAVSVPHNDWGIFLNASPNHLLALNHWEGQQPEPADTETEPRYDHQKMVATIAFESDQRLVIEKVLPGAGPCGGVLEIEADDAEFWYLAPQTVLMLNPAGQLVRSGDQPRILRDDSPRLAMLMAGALARYWYSRGRSVITVKGLLQWSGLIGQILTVVEEAGATLDIQSPITAIEWVGGKNPSTTLRTGFA